ncbi:metal ABC transporter solute-binding protein, Zn/Mn family [Rossellomorea yichunensis]|uniref:metal ABC transporter solute-binding protein, Zn/Mn family n=1 Tax=Rossellomorea yichunensis TaxID=3077331 RepID=UPI0028DFA53A|nr:zinc ABC transporter substrate-binding protein [Rossellomorea sp. YC4-1]MDT9024589.1 zinc ABC transporter substrate-binding protein [Rossellomorea sp. YC4-1]
MKIRLMALVGMIIILASGLILSGCGATTTGTKNDKIVVTTTIGQIGDAVKNIGGEHVEVQSLMGPGVDPHLYKAKQSDIGKFQEADIIFYSGLHLEGKMLEIFEKMNKEKPTYAIADSIPKDKLRKDQADNTATDPHVWFDIDLWKIALEQVRDGLIEKDPENKEDYIRNTEKYFAELDELKAYSTEEMSKIPEEQRVLVTAHDAFNYFGAKYDLQVMGLQGLSTDAEYGLADVQSLVNTLVERNIKAVFVESSISEKSINAVIAGAQDKGHEVEKGGELFSDAMGKEGTEEGTYIGMYKHNVDTIVEGLK